METCSYSDQLANSSHKLAVCTDYLQFLVQAQMPNEVGCCSLSVCHFNSACFTHCNAFFVLFYKVTVSFPPTSKPFKSRVDRPKERWCIHGTIRAVGHHWMWRRAWVIIRMEGEVTVDPKTQQQTKRWWCRTQKRTERECGAGSM